MKKTLFLIIVLLLVTGCEFVDDPTVAVTIAKRLSNTARCVDGCSVVIGDSNVFWYDWNFIPGNVCNKGIGGTQIQFVTDNMDAIAKLNPARLIIWTGQNDHKRPLEEIKADYAAMFAAMLKLTCPIYILSVHPYNGNLQPDNAQMMQINDFLRSHDGEGYTFIDIYNDIEACGEACYFNVGHLSHAGFEIIKTRILEII